MIRAHKIRLHPTTEQANYFARAAGTSRFVWNWALAEWNRQYAAGEKVARCYYKISCVRGDVLHKLTTTIAKTYGLVGIENLHVKGLLRNHCLALSLSLMQRWDGS